MNLDIFSGLPRYVRLTVYTQTRKLLSTQYFSYEDREDIMQDLLLYYLEQYYKIPDIDEALVVHALQLRSYKLLRKRKRSKAHLTSSLDYETFNEDFFYDTSSPQADPLSHTTIQEIFAKADNTKLKQALYLIMLGYSVDQISRQLHISKETIYKFFKKMKNL